MAERRPGFIPSTFVPKPGSPHLLTDLVVEVERLRAAILDIDAHATPMGEDDDGFVTGGYLVTVGSLHRALGVVGHTAPKCADCEDHEDAHDLRTAVHVLWSAMQRAMNHPEAWRDHLRPAMDRYRGTGDRTYKDSEAENGSEAGHAEASSASQDVSGRNESLDLL